MADMSCGMFCYPPRLISTFVLLHLINLLVFYFTGCYAMSGSYFFMFVYWINTANYFSIIC